MTTTPTDPTAFILDGYVARDKMAQAHDAIASGDVDGLLSVLNRTDRGPGLTPVFSHGLEFLSMNSEPALARGWFERLLVETFVDSMYGERSEQAALLCLANRDRMRTAAPRCRPLPPGLSYRLYRGVTGRTEADRYSAAV